MKVFIKLLMLISVVFTFSCNNPDGKIYSTSSEPVGWDQGKQVFTDYVIIQPTWGQSFYYNLKSGGTVEIVLGLVLFFAAAMWFVLLTKKVLNTNLLNILVMVVLLAGSLAFIFSGPGTIKWNNQIRIEKKRYESAKDDLPALWDELYYEKRIVGTSGQ